MWRRLALLSAMLLLGLPANAVAGVVFATTNDAYFAAMAGEVNDLQVSVGAGVVTFADASSVIAVGDGCQKVDDHHATCDSPGEHVGIELGDKDDTAVVLQASSVMIQGGGGEDQVTACAMCFGSLRGGKGNDTVTGGDGGFRFVGGPGDDSITGGAERDLILGYRGSDTIVGAGGSDIIFTGPGDDEIDGGPGDDDLALFKAHTGVTVDIQAGTVTGGYGSKTVTNIENVEGTRYSDTIYGDAGPNQISGFGSADVLVGRGGDDYLLGGCCRDRSDSNYLKGGPGNDRLWVFGRGHDLAVGGRGDDVLKATAPFGGHHSLYGGAGNDTFRTRDGARDRVVGGVGNDRARVDIGLDAVRGIESFF